MFQNRIGTSSMLLALARFKPDCRIMLCLRGNLTKSRAARLDVIIMLVSLSQASRQRSCCRDDCQISERLEKSKRESTSKPHEILRIDRIVNRDICTCSILYTFDATCHIEIYPDSKVHGANMGPIWGRQDPVGPHVGPMNFAIWVLNINNSSWGH